MVLQQVAQQLNNIGIIYLLVFALVLTVAFAILQKVGIFEERRFNAVIAIIMGLMSVMPSVLYGTPDPRDAVLSNGLPDIVEIIGMSLPNVSVVIVAILMALIILGILGKRVELGDNSLSGFIAFLSFAVIVYIFGNSAGWWNRPSWLRVLDNPDVIVLVVVILVFAIIIWFVTKDDNKETPDDRRIFKQFGSLLKGKE